MLRSLKPAIPPKHPDRYRSNLYTMAFQAVPAFLGAPNFGLIHIDPEHTAKAFQAYLDTASKLTGVSLDDINTNVSTMPASVSQVTLTDLLAHGMKLFDAIVWLTAGRPASHPLTVEPSLTKDKIPSMHEVARAVFYCYFMLVTQARYPVSRSETEKPRIPNFLKTIMGMDKEQHVYVDTICSFSPQKFDPAWAKHVSFAGFGQEVISRFGLGVAGYRMFGPFGLYNPKPDMDQSLLPAFEFARKIAKAPSSWNIHPLTRHPNVLTARGNLNKNLNNLMLDAFSQADLEEMQKSKVIYRIPIREPAHKQYKQWTSDDDITGTAMIFPTR